MPPRNVGRSAVQIVADVAQFGRELERDLNRQLRGVDVDAKPVADQISDAIDDATTAAGESFEGLERKATDALGAVADEATKLAAEIDSELEQVDRKIAEVERSTRDLAREFARTGDQDVFAKLRADRTALANLRSVREVVEDIGHEARQAGRALDDMGDEADRASRKTGTGLTASLGVVLALGAALGKMASVAPSPTGVVQFGAALVGLAAAIPVVLGVGAALADLIGLLPALPAAGAVGAAVMGTLQVALLGVADAIEAVIEGDPDKIKEAMQGLAPAARAVVREFRELLPTFKATQKFIQGQFFEPLRGSFTELSDLLLPTFRVGMGRVAESVGRLLARFVDLLTASGAIDVIDRLFQSVVRIVDRASESSGGFLDTILSLVDRGVPMLEKLVNIALDGADSFFEWFGAFAESGGLERFFQDALDTLSQLWDLTKSVFNLLGALFSRGDDEGRSFLQTLTETLNAMAEFLRSAEGQEFLQNLIDLMPLVAQAVGFLTTALSTQAAVINTVVDFWAFMADFYGSLPGRVSAAATAVGEWFVDAWNTASDAVAGFFTRVGQFFADLPGMIWGWIRAAGAALLAALKAAFDQALFQVGLGIGLILFAVTQLPGMIWRGLQALPPLIASLFRTAWEGGRRVTMQVLEAVLAFLLAFVTRSINSLLSMPGRIRAVFTSAVNAGRAAVVSGFNGIVAFVTSVPERLSALGGRFLSAGKSIISRFFAGLRATGGAAADVGAAIVGAVRRGLNAVIGSINSGISAIDSVLPGSLPRIPYLARGGMTRGFTLAALSEHGQREVVLPIEDERTMAALRAALGGAGTVVLSAGAIVVEIHGPVTEDQARRAGVAAGQGFLDTIDRREGRMAVRTL